MSLNHEDFKTRLKVSGDQTDLLIAYLIETGHFKDAHKATLDEDMDQGIDYWVDYGDGKLVPIQFKIRIDPAKVDIPVLRYQPFYGTDSEKTKIGRDFKGLLGKKTKYYYVAVKDKEGNFCEVLRMQTATLRPLVEVTDDQWENVSRMPAFYKKDFFTADQSQKWMSNRFKKVFESESSVEVWWQKNHNEKFAKFNFYIPNRLAEDRYPVDKAYIEQN